MKKTIFIFLAILLFFFVYIQKNEKENITIGYQSITAQTWGAIVIKEYKLLENELKNDSIKINWSNFSSGPPITSNMLAGKIKIGFMGDMPLLINGNLGQTNEYYDSYLAYLDGKGVEGHNQNILVLQDSPIINIKDLIGKTISVPNSSSAHRNLLQELYLEEIKDDQVNIIFQDIPTAIIMLENRKIDAISVWEPYPTYLRTEKNFRSLPKNDHVKYLAGVVINKKWADDNPEYEEAFSRALNRAHQMLNDPSEDLIKIISKDTGFSEEVVKNVVNNITWDSSIKPDDVDALEKDVTFLNKLNKITSEFNLNEFLVK